MLEETLQETNRLLRELIDEIRQPRTRKATTQPDPVTIHHQPQEPALLTERDVASATQISLPTLRRWRWLGTGPKFRKIGSLVRYSQADLDEFLSSKHSSPLS